MRQGRVVVVRDSVSLRRAAATVQPGDTIALEPGRYEGDVYIENLAGAPERPVVIAARDPQHPPIFQGGGECLHISRAQYLEIRDLVLERARHNGLNIDDGGRYESPSHHIVLKGITVRKVGPSGNCDGIKLSGITDFRVEGCTVEDWGDGGQGIDMVGCHRGLVVDCRLRFVDDKGMGVQAKGGCSRITVRQCRFERAGARAMQIGGSTGLQFFRPPLRAGAEHAEARDITVEGCEFIGSQAAISFVGVDGATARYNTIYRPTRWAIRILQETREPGFVPCRRGVFAHNIVVFYSDGWYEGGINIGPYTAPQTFRFERNWWYCVDAPARSKPNLPTAERQGVYGVDPLLVAPERGDLRLQPQSPATRYGASALPRP